MIHNQGRELSDTQPLRLIVVDDKPDWCKMLRLMVESLGHRLDEANTIEDAKRKIQEAEDQKEHIKIAIIDMNFESGDEEVQWGVYLVDYLKKKYPYIACVIASGDKVLPDDVLDLRDEHELDYYLQKNRIGMEKIKKAVNRSRARLADKWSQLTSVAQQRDEPSMAAPVRTVDTPARPGVMPRRLPSASPTDVRPEATQVEIDFQIEENDTRINWRSSLIGDEITDFTAPYSHAELLLVIRALDVLQHPHYPLPETANDQRHFAFDDNERATLQRIGLWGDGRVRPDGHQVIGEALFDGLGDDGQYVLKSIRNASIQQGFTTNYVLRFAPVAITLAALPWEVLWDREKNQAVLIRGNTIDSCERYVDLDMALPPPTRNNQTPHLLALSPGYGISDEVRERERTARLKTWDKLKAEGKITYDEISPLTMSNLNDYMDELPSRPDIVHYFGHGIYRDGQGFLLFDDGAGGRDLVSARRLAAALGDVRLIVIHACQSAMIGEEDGLLTGVAPALSVVTGAVVAMQLSVRTEAAARFTHVFYDQLLRRQRSLQEAVAIGRQRLFTEEVDGASWYVPTLYIRSRIAQPIYFTR